MEVVSYLLGKKQGGVTPTGEIEITENGITNVSGYATANVQVPQPSGKINITQNGTNIDVSSYATADVAVPSTPSKYAPSFVSFQGFTGTSLANELADLDTSNMTTMNMMFYNCKSLTSLDVSGFDTSNVTNMSSMFTNNQSYTSLDCSGWDTSNVTDMTYMFKGEQNYGTKASHITSLNVSGWDTSNVTNFSYMFQNMLNLRELDLSSWTSDSVTDIYGIYAMFAYCLLTKLDMRSFDFSMLDGQSGGSTGNSVFGGWEGAGLTNNCLFIVADDTQKNYVTTYCSRLTNVKTVAEYEAS